MAETKAAVMLKTIHLILAVISVILAFGISWGITSARLDHLEAKQKEIELHQDVLHNQIDSRIEKVEERGHQINRIEYNLRRLIEKNGLIYETFGDKNERNN